MEPVEYIYQRNFVWKPHTRVAKWIARLSAETCRKFRPAEQCAFYFEMNACPAVAFKIKCSEVQEGHWTMMHLALGLKNMRIFRERQNVQMD